ncbi:MAG: tryptophan 7-halogenase, partial [Caulobacteraceae bacterium]
LETFLPPSWQYILYGMGFPVSLPEGRASPEEVRRGEAALARVAQAGAEAVKHLPDHRSLVARYHAP